MGENLPFAGAYGLGVNRADDALAAKVIRRFGDHIRVRHSGGVEADLIGPRQQQGPHIRHGPHAAAHGQRDIAMLSGAGDQIEHRAAIFMGGVNVEKTKLIRPRRIIGNRGIHRVARITQADEVHTLHHTAIGHVETGDDAGLQHGSALQHLHGFGQINRAIIKRAPRDRALDDPGVPQRAQVFER